MAVLPITIAGTIHTHELVGGYLPAGFAQQDTTVEEIVDWLDRLHSWAADEVPRIINAKL